ncbi:hypothetical protein [Pseudomonas phage vB_Pae_SG_Moreira_PyoP2]
MICKSVAVSRKMRHNIYSILSSSNGTTLSWRRT